MFYKLLGMTVWKGGKLFLRRRYGAAMAPKPLLAGGLGLIAAAIVLGARQLNNGD